MQEPCLHTKQSKKAIQVLSLSEEAGLEPFMFRSLILPKLQFMLVGVDAAKQLLWYLVSF